jgi:hypothetical protein
VTIVIGSTGPKMFSDRKRHLENLSDNSS